MPGRGAAFQIAELVEHEQRMIAGAAEVPVMGASLLLAIGRADTRIHVEHDGLGRAPSVDLIDPSTTKIGERSEIPIARQPFGLEASDLAYRCRLPGDSITAYDPAHRRIAC